MTPNKNNVINFPVERTVSPEQRDLQIETEQIQDAFRIERGGNLTGLHLTEDYSIPRKKALLSFSNIGRMIKKNIGIDEAHGTAPLRKQLIGAAVGVTAILTLTEGAPRLVEATENAIKNDGPKIEHIQPLNQK